MISDALGIDLGEKIPVEKREKINEGRKKRRYESKRLGANDHGDGVEANGTPSKPTMKTKSVEKGTQHTNAENDGAQNDGALRDSIPKDTNAKSIIPKSVAPKNGTSKNNTPSKDHVNTSIESERAPQLPTSAAPPEQKKYLERSDMLQLGNVLRGDLKKRVDKKWMMQNVKSEQASLTDQQAALKAQIRFLIQQRGLLASQKSAVEQQLAALDMRQAQLKELNNEIMSSITQHGMRP